MLPAEDIFRVNGSDCLPAEGHEPGPVPLSATQALTKAWAEQEQMRGVWVSAEVPDLDWDTVKDLA